MSLSELLSRVHISSNTSVDVLLSDPYQEQNLDGAEQLVPGYDAPPPHEEDLPPSYPLSFSDAFTQWNASAEASVTLFDVEREHEEMESTLREMKKELKVLKERRYDSISIVAAVQAETVPQTALRITVLNILHYCTRRRKDPASRNLSRAKRRSASGPLAKILQIPLLLLSPAPLL